MYKIKNWFPKNSNYSGAAFVIVLTNKWKEAIKKTKLNQEAVNSMIDNYGPELLKGHGYEWAAENPRMHLRILWTNPELGLHVIQVPGDACSIGYDPTAQFLCMEGETLLSPHNVDSLKQASMILALFLIIAEYLELENYK